MKILLIHQYFLEKDDPGGARFNEMTRFWAAQGHSVTVLCGMVNYVTGKIPARYKGVNFHASFYYPGVEVLRCRVSERYNANFIGRLWAYFSFVWFSLHGIFGPWRKRRFEVVIATSPPLFVGITAMVVSFIRRVPYVFEVRDLWPESAIDTGVLTNSLLIRLSYAFEKLSYRRAALINVLTPAFKEHLITRKHVSPEKIVAISNACDFSMADELVHSLDVRRFRAALGWEDRFVLIYVGAHGVANHLIQLIDMAAQLTHTNALVVLVGDGMTKPSLRDEVGRRSLTNVLFVDPLPKCEVMKYILAADVGISALKKVDTFKTIYSNKTFDYMACRKAVLLAIDGVSRQLVEEAACGVYAEPENVRELATAALQLMTQPAETVAMGQRGYAFARQHFDREVLANQYLNCLEGLLC